MAKLAKPNFQYGHWYTESGDPRHSMDDAQGEKRPTTLADARKQHLYPSVTTILGMLAKKQLENWKLQQVAAKALVLKREKKESEYYFHKRIISEAFKQVDQAAELGTTFHNVMEDWIRGIDVKGRMESQVVFPTTGEKIKLGVCLHPLMDYLHSRDIRVTKPEACVVNKKYGYAGMVDYPFVSPKNKGVIDFKSRKTKPNQEVYAYDGQLEQIAAYAAAYWGEDALAECWGCNVYISTTEAGRVDAIFYKPYDLQIAFAKFTSLCHIWRLTNRYDPRGIDHYDSGKAGKAITVSFPILPSGDDPEAKGDAPEPKKGAKARKPKTDPEATAPDVMPFGKYKGTKLDDVPATYLDWLRGQPKFLDMHPNVKDYLSREDVNKAIDQDLKS